MFIFTSDHGYFYGGHCLSVERRLAYEETLRIPMAIRYPPLIAPGTVIKPMVLSIDLAPTILELAGAPNKLPAQGRSFVPLLKGQVPDDWRTSFVVEYFSDRVFPRIYRMGYQALRTERYPYIRYLELPGMDELYDLQTDPFQLDNLFGRPGTEELTRRLQAELAQRLAETQ